MPTLRGHVTVDGAPEASAVVELHNSQGDVLDQVQVDGEGGYVYHLVPGRWVLNVWDARGHRGSAQVEIKEGDEDTIVDVQLEPAEVAT